MNSKSKVQNIIKKKNTHKQIQKNLYQTIAIQWTSNEYWNIKKRKKQRQQNPYNPIEWFLSESMNYRLENFVGIFGSTAV